MAAPPVNARLLVAVAAGGMAGSLGRYAVSLALPHGPAAFPWSTLMVNLSGAFGIGLLVGYLVDRPGAHPFVRPVLGVGVLGGWTTFSALAIDAIRLAEGSAITALVGYLAATFLLGTLAVAAGTRAAQRMWPGP